MQLRPRYAVFASILLLLALVLRPAMTAADDSISFKGFPLGGNKDAFLARFPGLACRADRCSATPEEDCTTMGRACYKTGHSYGGVLPRFLAVEFREGRLVSVFMKFPTAQFAGLTDAMRVRYGAAGQDAVYVVNNRMGAAFENRRLMWEKGDVRLEVQQRTENLDEASVLLISRPFLEKLDEERMEKAREAAKGL